MDRGDVLSGAAFAAVLRAAVLFLVLLAAVGVASLRYVETNLTEELRQDVRMRWDLFAADYRGAGAGGLAGLAKAAARVTSRGRHAVGLFGPDGAAVAGNIAAPPAMPGWGQGPLAVAGTGTGGDAVYLYFAGSVGARTLVVGERRDLIERARRTIVRTLAITGFLVVLSMLGFGYWLSRRSLVKLQRVEAVLARVSDGDTAARIPVSPEDDQIDRIATRINTHLDALSRLMSTTRATAAAIAHDLRSPLARAYLGLGRARDRLAAGHDARDEIEDVQADLDQMRAMFDTYLQLARIEAGTGEAAFGRLDIGPLLDDLADTYRLVAEDAGQCLVFERDKAGRFIVAGDAGMIQRMAANLLQNAVTHAGPGSRITLRLGREAGAVRLSVADTGPGIPEAVRETVFEPFRRLDPSRSRAGSGLGLALVRAIADRHGARVALLDNAPGLRVEIVFPRPAPPPGA